MYMRLFLVLSLLALPAPGQCGDMPPVDTGYLVPDLAPSRPATPVSYVLPTATLIVHGGGHFTIEHASGVRAETYGDPIMEVDGVRVGHWPGSIVTYRLQDGTELTCRANGAQGDTASIEVWKNGVFLTAYVAVNTPAPRLTDNRPGIGGAQERGTILEWQDDTWKCVAE